jgi:parallel beta-helix repeat protein
MKKTISKLKEKRLFNRTVLLLFIFIFASLGLYTLINSKAAVNDQYTPAGQATSALDPTGKTIPTSNYAIPSGAIFMSTSGDDANNGNSITTPVKTINRAITLARATTAKTVVVRGGEYRDGYKANIPSGVGTISDNITIQAYPNESPWFTGADIVNNGWTSSGNIWVRDWSTPQFCRGTYYDLMPNGFSQIKQTSNQYDGSNNCTWWDSSRDPAYPVVADPQMAFIGSTQLAQKGSLAEVTAGSKSFYYDWNARKIYISENPTTNSVELATRPGFAVFGGAYNFAVKGIGFKRFASAHRGNVEASVVFSGLGGSSNPAGQAQFEKVVLTENAGATLAFSGPKNNTWVKNSVLAFNNGGGMAGNGFASTNKGYNGAPAPKNNILVEGSIFNSNNQGMFDTMCTQSCGVGAIKFNNMATFTVKNNIFENTKSKGGNGFWCDIDCSNGVIVGNIVRNNGGRGIFYEISSKGIIANNLVYDNDGAGISVFSASTKVYNNTVINKVGPTVEAFWISDDSRPAPDKGETWQYTAEQNQAAIDQLCAGIAPNCRVPSLGPNTNALEFANNLVVAQPGTNGARLLNFGNTASTYNKPPNTNSYEYFNVMDYNIYYAPTNRNIYLFANTDAIKTPAQLRTVSGQPWEQNTILVSTDGDPFSSRSTEDFRLKTDSQAYIQKGKPLPADVAAVMGQQTGAQLPRGAQLSPTSPTPPPTTKTGDLNNDNKVDVLDLSILLSNWDPTASKPKSIADINNDNKVDVLDLSALLSNWGK